MINKRQKAQIQKLKKHKKHKKPQKTRKSKNKDKLSKFKYQNQKEEERKKRNGKRKKEKGMVSCGVRCPNVWELDLLNSNHARPDDGPVTGPKHVVCNKSYTTIFSCVRLLLPLHAFI